PLARAVDALAARLRAGGVLHYVGAGTSGRLAALDAAEWPPTFGVPATLAQAHLAGGEAALARAVEGAEDEADAGTALGSSLARGDALVALSASGGAAYVVAAVAAARARGPLTVALTSASHSELARAAELVVVLETGPEPLTGSTRLVAGTAQKIALGTLSTALMVRLGKVYQNRMVGLRAGNAKLRARAVRLVIELGRVDESRARSLLALAEGEVPVAIVMARSGADPAAARARLASAGGLRDALS
ncbi:MAG: N-acetylmuramic acid 6-phosphate etherase, partial [Vulcanimicrobiaceae bacterium]